MNPAIAILLFAGICLVAADPEPEANPGWSGRSSGGYGGGVSSGGYSSGGISSGGFGGGHHGGSIGHGGHSGGYVSRPVVTQRVVKVVKPVVYRQPVVTRRVLVSKGYGGGHSSGHSSGYRAPVVHQQASYSRPSYGGGHGW